MSLWHLSTLPLVQKLLRARRKVLLSFPSYRWRKKALMKLNTWFKAKKGGNADWDLKLASMTLELTLLPAVLYCLQLNCPAPTWSGPFLPCDSCLYSEWDCIHLSCIHLTQHSQVSYFFLLLDNLLAYQYAAQGLSPFWSFPSMLQQKITPSYLPLDLLYTECKSYCLYLLHANFFYYFEREE